MGRWFVSDLELQIEIHGREGKTYEPPIKGRKDVKGKTKESRLHS